MQDEADTKTEVARLLKSLAAGDDGAAGRLFPLVYAELRGHAGRLMEGQRRGHTLQTTALVHEAYLRLVGTPDAAWESRAHFFRVAARAMRSILIDHARGRIADKRGGGWRRTPLDDAAVLADEPQADFIALDEALARLGEQDQQKAQVVELRFFGGLGVEETAVVMGISTATVKREWRFAKAWLHREITGAGGVGGAGDGP